MSSNEQHNTRSRDRNRASSLAVSDLSDPDFQSILQTTKTALLPVGSLEQHGPHLPASTDSIIAEHICFLVARKLPALVLPTVQFGVSFEHAPMLNVSIGNQTLSALVGDICVALSKNGISDIVILNGHHGNVGSLQYISQNVAGSISEATHIHTLHYWHFFSAEFDHAGEIETSLMLAIAPNLVRMNKAKPNSKKLHNTKAVYSSLTNAPGAFPMITGNGVWGDPRKASVQTGMKLIGDAVDRLISTIRELQKSRKVEL